MKSLSEALCLVTALGVGLVANAGEDIRWTEEVKLSDGSVIQIQRHVELTTSGFPLQKRGFTKYHEICYPPLGIHWKSRSAYQPDIFDIVDGKAYMHVPIEAECYEQGSPETGAIYFVWDNGEWKRIGHNEFPTASEWNLLMSIVSAPGHETSDPHGLLTLQYKLQRRSSLRNEQKRLGWKRVNESYAYRDGCKHWTRTARFLEAGPVSIFFKDDRNTCQP